MKAIKRRKEVSTKRKRRILDAALTCFLKNGYERTTIRHIRHLAGVSHGSLYHHFNGKDAIAIALYAEGMRDYCAGAMADLQWHATVEAGIRAIVAFHLRWNVANRELSLYLTRVGMADAVGEVAAEILKVRNEFIDSLYEWLKPFVERGEIARLAPHLYASVIMGPPAHLTRYWLSGGLKGDLLEAAEPLGGVVWKSLKVVGNRQPA